VKARRRRLRVVEERPEAHAGLRRAEEHPAHELQRQAGNAATARVIQGKGPLEEDRPLLGRLQRNGGGSAAAGGAVAAPADTRKSQDVTVSPIAAPNDLGRGGFSWKVWFSTGSNAGADGWVIQEISMVQKATKSGGGALDDSIHYWEAWQLKKDKKTTIYQDEGLDDNDDQYYTAAQPAGSKGSIKVVGKVRFFEGALPADFKKNNPSTYAGELYSSTSAPPYWSGSMAQHDLTSTWDDSASPSKTDIKHVP
jgi:hypothetical protein